jgi:hypothetical protein
MPPLYIPCVCIIACILIILAQYRRGEGFADPTEFYLRGDGQWAGNQMVGASAISPGAAGFVPTPSAGTQGAYLRGDGQWAPQSYGLFTLAPITAGGAQARISPVSVGDRAPFMWNTRAVYSSGITCTGPIIIFNNPGVYMLMVKLQLGSIFLNLFVATTFIEIAYSPNDGKSWIATAQTLISLLPGGTSVMLNTMASTDAQSALWRVQYQYALTAAGTATTPPATISMSVALNTNSLTIYRVA